MVASDKRPVLSLNGGGSIQVKSGSQNAGKAIFAANLIGCSRTTNYYWGGGLLHHVRGAERPPSVTTVCGLILQNIYPCFKVVKRDTVMFWCEKQKNRSLAEMKNRTQFFY